MHPYKRSERLSILLREEIADIVMHKIKDPRLGFVTVTDVGLSNDLKTAKVFISVIEESHKSLAIEILTSATGLIRAELAKRVRVKFIPTLAFKIDDTYEKGSRIDSLLELIKQGQK